MLKLAGELLEGQLAEHIADLDAHTRDLFQMVKPNSYLASPLAAVRIPTSPIAMVADTLYAIPYPITRARTPDQLALQVYTADAGKSIRIGIYKDNGSVYPGERLTNGGTVATDTTGLKTVAYTTQLVKGLYWIAIISDGTPALGEYRAYLPIIGNTSSMGDQLGQFKKSQSYGDLPDPFPSGASLEYDIWTVGLRFTSND